uniref:Uncharacterized protein n=1 Tax=Oryza punctata TaxID=4537 RepID=A0A0E0LMM7_ORYPU
MKMMSMVQIMRKTSVVVLEEEDLHSSAIRRAPSPREVCIRLHLTPTSVAKAEDATRGGKMPPPLPTKRRREVDDDDDASRASKKKHVAEPALRLSGNKTIPLAQASSKKEEALVRCSSAARHPMSKNCSGNQRSRESAPSPSPARLDSLTAQDALSAAIAVARSVLDKRREEAWRELAKMVRTVEFNDPYISPTDVLKT